jgi:hypothetical protein
MSFTNDSAPWWAREYAIGIPQYTIDEIANPNNPSVKRIREEAVEGMLVQKYSSKFAKVVVRRRLDEISIEWKIEEGYRDHDFRVDIQVSVMTFDPDPNTISGDKVLDNHTGNGSFSRRFGEGLSYHFLMLFFNRGLPEATDIREKALGIVFNVSIPFSTENLTVCAKALQAEQNPAANIRDQIEALFKIQDTFDEMIELGKERIKAKGLPSNEEQMRIEQLTEKIDEMKETFGL